MKEQPGHTTQVLEVYAAGRALRKSKFDAAELPYQFSEAAMDS